MGEMWNLWHGCHKKSEGCQHCYVFRRDAEFEKDSNVVTKTSCFNLPICRNRQGEWKVPSGTLMWTCFTSDFFIEEADQWREDAWLMIHRRSDLHFFMITKRPERILQCLPEDWGDGYENVTICCTMENQRRVDERLPIYRELPIRHKSIICEPLLESIDFHGGLGSWCEQVTVGGSQALKPASVIMLGFLVFVSNASLLTCRSTSSRRVPTSARMAVCTISLETSR